MLRRVTNLALRRGRTDKEHRASAPPVQAIRPWSTEPSNTPEPNGLDGIAAAVASLAHGQAPAITTDRIALTSGAKNDSAVQDILNQAEDGTEYWGPIDNDSARSKAAGETLIIDQWECIQCGTCVENTDAVFALPDDSKASVFNQEGPMDLIQDAIDACPVTCISWTTEPDSFEQLNDHEGNKLD